MDNDIFNRGIANLIYEALSHPGHKFIYSCYWDEPKPLTPELEEHLIKDNSFRTNTPVKYIKDFFSFHKEIIFISLQYHSVIKDEPFRITFYNAID